MNQDEDVTVPAPISWSRASELPGFTTQSMPCGVSRAPVPAEACSEFGFENEPAPRRARLGGVHGLERWFLSHPTATTVGLLVLVGLAYLGTAK